MKTITERDGKNVNMQVVGDLHQYPDGSVHTVKEGKAVWEEGGEDSGGSGGGGGVKIIEGTISPDSKFLLIDKNLSAVDFAGSVIHFMDGSVNVFLSIGAVIGPVLMEGQEYYDIYIIVEGQFSAKVYYPETGEITMGK